jgi:hypothetical protein
VKAPFSHMHVILSVAKDLTKLGYASGQLRDSSVRAGRAVSAPLRMTILAHQKFFLPSGGVFIESAHTKVGETFASAAVTLTLCLSETGISFRRFDKRRKLADAEQLIYGELFSALVQLVAA